MKKKIKWTRLLVVTILTAMLLCGCQSKDEGKAEEHKAPEYPNDVQELLNTLDVSEVKQAIDPVIPEALQKEDLKNIYKVKVKVNPEVELYISSDTGQVMYVNCINEDAESLAKEGKLEFVGKPYEQATEEFINTCAKEKYLTSKNSTIEITASKVAEDSASIPSAYTEVVNTLKQNVRESVDFPVDIKCPCPYCNATGICELCLGEKKIICDACNGTVNTECPQCHNEIMVVCDHCNGEITIKDIRTCDQCGGNFKWDCTICNGTGRIACETCGGNGKWNCSSCNNTCTQTCNLCSGNGCGMCNNTGLMECTACHGHALDKCPNCDGSCIDYCNPCRGEGFNFCTGCNLTGVIDNTHICSVCNETGLIECPTCKGGEAPKCYRCEGVGKMNCVNCNDDGLCPHCHGLKEIDQREME